VTSTTRLVSRTSEMARGRGKRADWRGKPRGGGGAVPKQTVREEQCFFTIGAISVSEAIEADDTSFVHDVRGNDQEYQERLRQQEEQRERRRMDEAVGRDDIDREIDEHEAVNRQHVFNNQALMRQLTTFDPDRNEALYLTQQPYDGFTQWVNYKTFGRGKDPEFRRQPDYFYRFARRIFCGDGRSKVGKDDFEEFNSRYGVGSTDDGEEKRRAKGRGKGRKKATNVVGASAAGTITRDIRESIGEIPQTIFRTPRTSSSANQTPASAVESDIFEDTSTNLDTSGISSMDSSGQSTVRSLTAAMITNGVDAEARQLEARNGQYQERQLPLKQQPLQHQQQTRGIGRVGESGDDGSRGEALDGACVGLDAIGDCLMTPLSVSRPQLDNGYKERKPPPPPPPATGTSARGRGRGRGRGKIKWATLKP